MKSLRMLAVFLLVLGMAVCSFYRSSPTLNYYHGASPPEGYVKIVRAAETEVEFLITVVFPSKHMYHLLLDGNQPLAEGWFPTARMAASQGYSVTLKLGKGLRLEPGKTYRLCIGAQSPEAVQMTTNNYLCLVDYEFVFKAK